MPACVVWRSNIAVTVSVNFVNFASSCLHLSCTLLFTLATLVANASSFSRLCCSSLSALACFASDSLINVSNVLKSALRLGAEGGFGTWTGFDSPAEVPYKIKIGHFHAETAPGVTQYVS